MTGRRSVAARGRGAPILLALVLVLGLPSGPAWADEAAGAPHREETFRNVALFVIPRQIVFFSGPLGTWTSVNLDAGERVIQRGAEGNVAAVVTSLRAIGYSAVLDATDQLRLPEDEPLDGFQIGGNVAVLLTRRQALGFSAYTGKWTATQRNYPGR